YHVSRPDVAGCWRRGMRQLDRRTPSARRCHKQFATQHNVAVVNLDRFAFVWSDPFCDRIVKSVAVPSERVNLLPPITKKRDTNRHGFIDSERRSGDKLRLRDLMQMSLAKCLRIKKDQIASHFIHWSDVDDVILVERVTAGALGCHFAIQF